jgi:hypothetical protein
MPERLTRLLIALLGAALFAIALAPGATAQSDEGPLRPGEDPADRWAGSAFTTPGADATVRKPEVDVAGQFTYRKRTPGQRIVAATVEVQPDGFEPPATCETPPSQPIPGNSPHPSDYDMDQPATLGFEVSDLRLPCNGRYLAHATAQLEDGTQWSMQVRFGVAVAPPQVDEVTAELDGDERAATISFTPLELHERSPDEAGYLIERAGPDDGTFTEVATVTEGSEPRTVDDLGPAEPGRYVYRVRPLRNGVDGPVPSEASGAPTAEVQLEGPPTTPTTTPGSDAGADRQAPVRRNRSSSRVTSGSRPGTSTTRSVTPTTLDTGFEDTIDYGELPDGSSEELAGDEPVAGQSIVQDEADDPVDLAVPAAGALVLLGWAGHIVYLNRLAKLL